MLLTEKMIKIVPAVLKYLKLFHKKKQDTFVEFQTESGHKKYSISHIATSICTSSKF